MSYRKFQIFFFISVLAISGILTLLVFQPYFTLLAFGGVLAVLSHPLYKYLYRILKSRTAAALVTLFTLVVIVLVPIGYFLVALSSELIQMAGMIKDMFAVHSIPVFFQKVLPASLHDQIPAFMAESVAFARSVAEAISSHLFAFFSNIFRVFFGFGVILISTYYFLKDGHKIKKEMLMLSPLSDEYDELVFQRIFTAVKAVMGGVLVMGLLKGVLAGIAYWALGVPAPIFWGLITGLASFLPFIGSGLISVPAAIYLFMTGHVVAGVIMLAIAVLIIGTVDNLLQPKLVQSRTKIHPLLILLAILGGLQFYGFPGFVLGPLTLSVTMGLIDIYKKEFKQTIERAME